MKKVYKQIALLYVRNPIFVFLGSLFVVGGILSRPLRYLPYPTISDDIFSTFFSLAIWLLFVIGVMMKRQFANHRASLLPRFRPVHLRCGIVVYFFFLLTSLVWLVDKWYEYWFSPLDLWSMFSFGVFLSVLIPYLAYLSIGMLVFFAYFVFVLIFGPSLDLVLMLSESVPVIVGMNLLSVVLLGFWICRLMRLREEHFEYPYLLAWPQKDFIRNQLKAGQVGSFVFRVLRRWFRIQPAGVKIPPYPRKAGVFRRAFHWDCLEYTGLASAGILFALMTPLYLLYLDRILTPEGLLARTYSNFLLLAVTPVLLVICANSRRMLSWPYDLLKPIRKERFFKERGVALGVNLLVYWVVFAIYFAILPNVFIHPEMFVTKKFWAYVGMTAGFSFLGLSWTAVMSALTEPRTILSNGIVFCLLTLLFHTQSPHFPLTMIWGGAVLFLIGGAVLIRIAYRKWCEKEVGVK